jgi:hypothetical protein
VLISDKQRRLHMRSELLAVLVVAPFSFWLASRRELPRGARVAAGVLGVATLAVDGYLLSRYLGVGTVDRT